MDKAETYIKMADCPEIQGLRRGEKHRDTGKWQEGDFWTTVFRPSDKVFVVHKSNDAWADEPHYLHHPTECIWLPRQDQLQEMVGLWVNNRFEVMSILKKFYDFTIKELCSDLTWNLFSMEQLWLAFVMKELHNKVWSGTEWINQST